MKKLNYREYLQVLFDSILFKDIVKRYNIRRAALLENLAAWLISNITAEFSLNFSPHGGYQLTRREKNHHKSPREVNHNNFTLRNKPNI